MTGNNRAKDILGQDKNKKCMTLTSNIGTKEYGEYVLDVGVRTLTPTYRING